MSGGSSDTPKGSILQHVRHHPYHLYVLVLVTFVYLLNQLDRYLYVVLTRPRCGHS